MPKLKLPISSFLTAGIALLLSLSAPIAHAAAIQLTPSQDATVSVAGSLGGPDANTGSLNRLFMISGDQFSYSDPLLQFDLSAYAGDTLTGSPTLNMFVNGTFNNQDVGGQTLAIDDLTAAWTEGGVTWNNQPGLGASIGSGTFNSITPGTEITITLDEATVQSWIDNPSGNLGIEMYERTLDTGHDIYFNSREATSDQPFLSFTVAPAPEPGTMLLSGLGLLGTILALRSRKSS